MCGFSKGQRLIARDKERENVQRCVNVDKLVNETITSIAQTLTVAESDQEVKFDQETASTDVKFTRQGTSCGELRSAGGSSNVSKESLMSASTENAVIEGRAPSQWCTVLRWILAVQDHMSSNLNQVFQM